MSSGNKSTKAHITAVLAQGYLMSLGTSDSSGVWVADVIYVHDDDLNLYWISDPQVRHSRALVDHPQVAAAITVNQPGEDNFGIQVSGHAEEIPGSHYDLAVKHLKKRHKIIPVAMEDILKGHSWYKLTPHKIDLIHEKIFGFKKQTLELRN